MRTNFGHYQFELGQACDIGLRRCVNEDNIFVDEQRALFAISDGMGGHGGGDVASAIVIETIQSLANGAISIETIIRSSHQQLCQCARAGMGSENMGATVVVAQYHTQGMVELAWVGDSRAYSWNGIRLARETKDHSLVQAMVDKNVISEEEALAHPQRNLLVNALGAVQNDLDVFVDTKRLRLSTSDSLLLCSDGLTSEVRDEDIARVLTRNEDNQKKVDILIHMAKKNGGRDNISIVLISFAKIGMPNLLYQSTLGNNITQRTPSITMAP